MFIGEFSCLLVFTFTFYREKSKWKKCSSSITYGEALEEKARELGTTTYFNSLWFAIPACFDVMASTLMFAGLTQSGASIYQMMRGTIVLVVAIFSVIFLKRKLYIHHWIGVSLVIIGVTLVGIASQVFKEGTTKTSVVGIILLLASQIMGGCLFISEEKLLSKFSVYIYIIYIYIYYIYIYRFNLCIWWDWKVYLVALYT